MQKRVLSFLMVLALVISMLPMTLVGAETAAAAEPGYTVTIQKAHNQTENFLAVDVYLQANTADQGDVTGYQFTATPAEGLSITSVVDFTGNDGIAGSGTEFVYSPTLADPIAVGTSRVLVATVTLTGETLPAAAADALTLSAVTVSVADGFYSDDAEDAATEGYKGAVATANVADGCTHECAHGEGVWTPVTVTELNAGTLAAGNYYLVSDVDCTKSIKPAAANDKINLCLNGYTLSSTTQMFVLDKDGAELNICDCTATGSGENLQSGKLLLKRCQWGNLRCSNPNTKINAYGFIIEADEAFTGDGNAATFYQGENAANSKIYAEDVLIRNVHAKTLVDTRAEGYYKDLTIVNCSGGQNSDTDDLGIFTTNGNHAKTGTVALTLDGVKFIDCDDEILDTNGKKNITFTLKGDVQAEGAVYVNGSCKVNLELGENADVTILTEKDKTEENLGDYIVIPEGATLPSGTLLYKNVDLMVEYVDGKFSFVGHSHKATTYDNGTEEGHTVEGMSFKAWDDSDSLPTEGNYYLTTDVTINSDRYSVGRGKTLNLDLNGHTVTQAKEMAASGTSNTNIYVVYGTLNLFDCCSGYDAEGNWIGGQLTGGTGTYGGAIAIDRSQAGKDNNGVFNMYGGRICGNSTTSSGGAIYLYSSLAATAGNQSGGEFNMYGGELYNNHSDVWGGAITANGLNAAATSGSKGVDPALNMGAKVNIHGGKIHGNTAYKRDTTNTGWSDATIYLAHDASLTMTDGEISDNSAHRGGAIFMNQKTTKATITGGKISGNTAVESAQMVAKKSVDLSGKGGAIYCAGGTVYIENAEISDNTATQGGAFYFCNGANTNVDIINCVIDGNSAYDSRTEKFHDTATNDANRHWGNGGAMYITTAATDVYVKDCQITNNTAAKKTNWNDYQGAGGGAYVYASTKTVFEGCTFSGNDTSVESGGALYLYSGADVLVKDCVLTENTAGTAGAAAYIAGTTTLRLQDSTVYNNTLRSNLGGAGIYVTSATSRVVVSGKVVVDQNHNTLGTVGRNDIFFQSQATRVDMLEVDELAKGSHMTIFFDATDTSTSPIIVNKDDASGYVKITEGGTQSDWECGWVTAMRRADTVGRQVAYVDLTDDGVDNKTFEFGHYHKGPDGTYHLLNAWTGTASLPDKNDATTGNGYYLTKDVELSSAANSAECSLTAHSATGYDYELCLNGHTITAKSGLTTRAIVLRSVNGWIGDCTASFDENGYLLSGGVIEGMSSTQNGGALYFTDDQNIGTNVTVYGIEVKDSFETTKRDGTASYGYSGAGIHARNKSSAIDNTDVTVIGCKFTGNHTPMEGGAINSLNGADFTITDTIFQNNSSGRLGGAISLFGGSSTVTSDLVLDNCQFLNNTTTSNPKKWTDDTTTEEDETITPIANTGMGGAIYGRYTKMTIKDCYFEGNQALNAEALTNTNHNDNGLGGAIYVTSDSDLDIDGCVFKNNHAKYQGGAIFIYGTNSAYDGHTIDDTVFEGNTANSYGGALFTYNSNTSLTITGTKEKPVIFRNNTSLGQEYQNGTDDAGNPVISVKNGYGGAYDIMNGKITITGAEFYGNQARVSGGAVRTAGGGGTTVALIDGCIFDSNHCEADGGALYLNGDTTTIQNCTITNNTADSDGGAMTVKSTNAAADVQTVTNCVISGNTAGYGGAFAVYGNTTYAPVLNITGGVITNNTGKTDGGAFFGHSNDATNQKMPTVNVTGTTISGNYGKTGGVVYSGMTANSKAYDGMTMTFDNCQITGNSATVVSAFQMCNETKITLKDTDVTGNWTTGSGSAYGAINFNTSTSHLYVEGDSSVYDNYMGKDSGKQHNVFMRNFANNMTSVYIDTANGATLADTAKIGIYLEGTSKRTQYAVTNDGTKIYADNFVADQDQYDIVTIDAADKVYISQAGYGSNIYIDAQKAIDAINAAVAADATADKTLKLFGDVKADLTSESDLFIDLEGKSIQKLTMAEGTKLTLIDSETNDYDVADGVYGKIVIEGDYDTYYEDNTNGLKRYVVVTDAEGVSSAHRVYLAINKKVLRTANAGIGFKAIFAGDQVVEEYITGYGIKVWKTENPDGVKYADFMHYEFENGTGNGAPNQVTAVVKNVLEAGNAENQARFETGFTGMPVITIGEGEGAIVIEGKTVATSMYQIAKNNSTNADVQNLLTTYSVTIQ